MAQPTPPTPDLPSGFRMLTTEEYINGNYITLAPSSFYSSTSLEFDMLNSAWQQGTQGIHQLLRHNIATYVRTSISLRQIIGSYEFDEDQLAVISPKVDELLKKFGFADGVETKGLHISGFTDMLLDNFGLATVNGESVMDSEYLITTYQDGEKIALVVYYIDGSVHVPAFFLAIENSQNNDAS